MEKLSTSVDSLHKGSVIWTFDIHFMLARTNCWTKTRMAGDLRHHNAHVTSLKYNPNKTKPHAIVWRLMNVTASGITGISTVCSTTCEAISKDSTKSLPVLCEGIHQSPIYSPHDGLIMRKASWRHWRYDTFRIINTSWWRHKWNHFPRYWPFVRGIHRSPVNSPHKGQWRGALMFSLICTWIDGWVNNREAGDLRRHRAHYEVTVMSWGGVTIW